jgi:hypothetical protein
MLRTFGSPNESGCCKRLLQRRTAGLPAEQPLISYQEATLGVNVNKFVFFYQSSSRELSAFP